MESNPESANAGAELPGYKYTSRNSSSHHEPGPSGDEAGSEGQRRRANYALSLQKACNVALQRVKSNNVVANSNWASPLAAAPSAISTMAILLKAADQEAAAGLEIESQDVKAEDGSVVGTLPLVSPTPRDGQESSNTKGISTLQIKVLSYKSSALQ